MIFPAGQQRIIDHIDGTLRASEPHLASMFAIFARLHAGEPVWVEPAARPRSRPRRRVRWLRAGTTIYAFVLIPAMFAMITIGALLSSRTHSVTTCDAGYSAGGGSPWAGLAVVPDDDPEDDRVRGPPGVLRGPDPRRPIRRPGRRRGAGAASTGGDRGDRRLLAGRGRLSAYRAPRPRGGRTAQPDQRRGGQIAEPAGRAGRLAGAPAPGRTRRSGATARWSRRRRLIRTWPSLPTCS